MSTEQNFTGRHNVNLGVITTSAPAGHFGIDVSDVGVAIPDELAPALALAILEAAGIVPTAHESYASADHDRTLEDAAWEIRRIVTARARESEAAAKEAADREVLEAEARILFDAGTDHLTQTTLASRKPLRWDEVSDAVRAAHVTVALKAREIHKAVS